MTGKSMADVLGRHFLVGGDCCTCCEMYYDTRLTPEQIEHEHSLHVEMQLHNAGFGHIATAIDDAAEQEDS